MRSDFDWDKESINNQLVHHHSERHAHVPTMDSHCTAASAALLSAEVERRSLWLLGVPVTIKLPNTIGIASNKALLNALHQVDLWPQRVQLEVDSEIGTFTGRALMIMHTEKEASKLIRSSGSTEPLMLHGAPVEMVTPVEKASRWREQNWTANSPLSARISQRSNEHQSQGEETEERTVPPVILPQLITMKIPNWEQESSPLFQRKLMPISGQTGIRAMQVQGLELNEGAVENEFSLFCWNIMFSPLCGKRQDQGDAFSPSSYCPVEYLSWSWRLFRIVSCIKESHAGLLALQEVPDGSQWGQFQQELGALNYQCMRVSKVVSTTGKNEGHHQVDGCAICWKKTIFSFLDFLHLQLAPDLSSPVIGVAILVEHMVSKRRLIVATTQLEAAKLAEPLRMQQMKKFLNAMVARWGGEKGNEGVEEEERGEMPSYPLVLGGDFNTEPYWGLVPLLKQQQSMCFQEEGEGDNQGGNGTKAAEMQTFGEVYSDYSAIAFQDKPYTCFTPHTQDQLDYIFYTKRDFVPLKLWQVPSDREIVSLSQRDTESFIAPKPSGTVLQVLPTPSFPSHHLPLLVHFGWTASSSFFHDRMKLRVTNEQHENSPSSSFHPDSFSMNHHVVDVNAEEKNMSPSTWCRSHSQENTHRPEEGEVSSTPSPLPRLSSQSPSVKIEEIDRTPSAHNEEEQEERKAKTVMGAEERKSVSSSPGSLVGKEKEQIRKVEKSISSSCSRSRLNEDFYPWEQFFSGKMEILPFGSIFKWLLHEDNNSFLQQVAMPDASSILPNEANAAPSTRQLLCPPSHPFLLSLRTPRSSSAPSVGEKCETRYLELIEKVLKQGFGIQFFTPSSSRAARQKEMNTALVMVRSEAYSVVGNVACTSPALPVHEVLKQSWKASAKLLSKVLQSLQFTLHLDHVRAIIQVYLSQMERHGLFWYWEDSLANYWLKYLIADDGQEQVTEVMLMVLKDFERRLEEMRRRNSQVPQHRW